MANESSVSHEEYRPSEQSPGDHGEIKIPYKDDDVLVDAEREYRRPSESEPTPPAEDTKTVLIDDPRDPVDSTKK